MLESNGRDASERETWCSSYWFHFISGLLRIRPLHTAGKTVHYTSPDVKGTATASDGPGSLLLFSVINRCS